MTACRQSIHRASAIQQEIEALDADLILRRQQREHPPRLFQPRIRSKSIQELQAEDEATMRRIAELRASQRSFSGVRIFSAKVKRAVTVMHGAVSLLLGLSILGALVMTLLDRILHSSCGSDCGLMLDAFELFAPIEYALISLSELVRYFLIYFYFILSILHWRGFWRLSLLRTLVAAHSTAFDSTADR